MILAYYIQSVFSQTIDGSDLNKIPGLENFTDFNNGVPETLDDRTQDANNVVPDLDDAPDEPNLNQVKISFSGSVTEMDDRSNVLYGRITITYSVSGWLIRPDSLYRCIAIPLTTKHIRKAST